MCSAKNKEYMFFALRCYKYVKYIKHNVNIICDNLMVLHIKKFNVLAFLCYEHFCKSIFSPYIKFKFILLLSLLFSNLAVCLKLTSIVALYF